MTIKMLIRLLKRALRGAVTAGIGGIIIYVYAGGDLRFKAILAAVVSGILLAAEKWARETFKVQWPKWYKQLTGRGRWNLP